MAPHYILLAFLICSSFSIPFQTQKAEAVARTTNSLSHCKKKCGEMDIRYPFGMKKGCYLDESFEITCNHSTGSATLVLFDGEVDKISDHSLRYKKFSALTLSFNKSGESEYGHAFGLNFLGSHYLISNTSNKFVAMGCDFYAYLVDGERNDLLGGCASFCNRTDIVPSRSSMCKGLNCCEMNLLRNIKKLTLNVDTINTMKKSWKCGLFTLMEKEYPINKINFSASKCEDIYTVPMILEWVIGNTSCKEATRDGCGKNTVCIDSSTHIGKGYRCKCSEGFKGNPYLLDGCQDVDECANHKHNCPRQDLCVNTAGSYYCSDKRKRTSKVLIALGTGIAVGILTLVAIGLWIWQKLKKINDQKTKQRFFKRNGGLLLQRHIASGGANVLPESTIVKIEELEKATNKFSESRVLGKGGHGTVYKGMLTDGRIVAVKKANITVESQVGQFINEVFILSQISHRHIVKLLGCCLENEVPLLVYEYVSNGTLSNHIHGEPNTPTISWEDRLRIGAEVAEALAYMHFSASTAIFHRDIKSSNILLDEKYKAVVSDFGVSRSVSIDRTHLTTLVGGTFGYLDPEYFRTGQLNDKSDVYSFGVVLAEILTGQKAVSSAKDDTGLARRFQSAVKEDRLFEILEKVVADEGDKDEILAVAKLCKRCLKVNARKRPSMKEVAAELDQLRKRRELPGHQESFCDEHRSTSEDCYTYEIDPEAEDDQTISVTD